jgi:AraC family transcriptional regulator
LAKIAVELKRALARRAEHGTRGRAEARLVASGDGWSVADVVCTSGPQDRPFEEQHTCYSIAMVVAGSFEYRSPRGRGLMTPGSLMLGNAGHCFECGHTHAEGDRCVAFWFTPDYFERIAAGTGVRGSIGFRQARMPALPPLSPLVARAAAGAVGSTDVDWEELGVRLAVAALAANAGAGELANGLPLNAAAKVTRSIRAIERRPDAELSLQALARGAGLSPYHFLRTFERLTGVTPHQYVMRARLRDAAVRLVGEPAKIVDIALDSGFGDVSNFNRAFRAEFGVSPSRYRRPASREAGVRARR